MDQNQTNEQQQTQTSAPDPVEARRLEIMKDESWFSGSPKYDAGNTAPRYATISSPIW